MRRLNANDRYFTIQKTTQTFAFKFSCEHNNTLLNFSCIKQPLYSYIQTWTELFLVRIKSTYTVYCTQIEADVAKLKSNTIRIIIKFASRYVNINQYHRRHFMLSEIKVHRQIERVLFVILIRCECFVLWRIVVLIESPLNYFFVDQ